MRYDIKAMNAKDHAELRKLLEECEVVNVSDEVREYIERHMPDLADRLPPRVLH
jgi:hypothetical protein